MDEFENYAEKVTQFATTKNLPLKEAIALRQAYETFKLRQAVTDAAKSIEGGLSIIANTIFPS